MVVEVLEEKIENWNISEVGILLVELAFSLIGSFISIFLIAHIFVLLNENFVSLGIFTLVSGLFVFIFQMFGGSICKRKTPLLVIRLSAGLSLFLLILILFLDEQLAQYYILLALLWGSIMGFYFSASQFIIAKKTSGEKMLRFVATYTSIMSILQLIFPITFGLIIYYGGFFATSTVVLVIAIFQLLASMLIKPDSKIEKTDKIDFKDYWMALKKAKHQKPALELWFIMFLTGFANTIPVLITAFVMLAFGSALNLGILVSLFALIKIFIPYFYRKFKKSRLIFYWIAIIFPIASVSLLLIFGTPPFVILFMGVNSVTRGIIFMEEEKTRLSAASYWNGGKLYIMESNLFYETALTTGGVISAVLLIMAGSLYSQWIVMLFLALTSFSFALHGILVKLWQKKHAEST